jgi:hypothetical protein
LAVGLTLEAANGDTASKRVAPMQYHLRTLLILLAIGPPMLAVAWWFDLTPIVAGIVIWCVLAFALLALPGATAKSN